MNVFTSVSAVLHAILDQLSAMVTKIQTKQSISVLNCWAVSGCAVDLAHIV